MSDLTDNTSELDSYGVWVKPQTANDPADTLDIDLGLEDISIDSISDDPFDIPDIADETISSDEVDLSAFDDPVETTELETEIPDTTEVIEETEDSSDDFQLPEEDGEISLDDFLDGGFSDESVASGNNGFAPGEGPSSNKTEEVSLDDFSDGEISLDDFLDGSDFSSGPAPEAKETKAEEIIDEKPLEMDISFDNSADEIKTEDNIQSDEEFEEEPSFTEVDHSMAEAARNSSTEIFGDTEEIDLSDFGIDAEAEETPITQDIEESKAKDEVVDFDLCVSDEKLASAPVVNEIKESASDEPETEEAVVAPAVTPAPAQESSSSVNNDLLQQIINELSGMKAEINALKSNLEEMQNRQPEVTEPAVEETVTDETVTEEEIIPETTAEDSSGFFDDVDGDDTIALSGDELDNMLSGVEISEETITEEEPVVEETVIEETVTEEPVIEDAVIEETVIEEPVIEDTVIEETAVTEEDVIIPETKEDDSMGFFDDVDGDDTIALSGNELDSILSNVEISEETSGEEIEEAEIETEEVDDIPEEIDIEPVSTETVDDDIFGSVEDDIFASEEETVTFGEETEDTAIDSEEVMEEPNLDDLSAFNIEETEEESEEIPEEISIDKTEDILVESANNDFMDSVKDTTETTEEIVTEEPVIEDLSEETVTEEDPFADIIESEETLEETAIEEIDDNAPVEDFDEFMKQDPSDEESLTESNIDYLNLDENLPTETEEEPVTETDDFPSVDLFDMEEEPAVTEDNGFMADETVVEETVAEEPVIEEEPVVVEEEPISEEIEETAVDIPEETPVVAETSEEAANEDLKKDIKSVLLYMDQLLENLPEEKIVEFAKSEEFSTYKKLFSELGLA